MPGDKNCNDAFAFETESSEYLLRSSEMCDDPNFTGRVVMHAFLFGFFRCFEALSVVNLFAAFPNGPCVSSHQPAQTIFQ